MNRQASSTRAFSMRAKATSRAERAIQKEVDAKDPKDEPEDAPMQAGAREYPVEFSQQHLKKPGIEADLKEAPMYDAPHYKGSDKLKNKVAIITGGDSGIGRSVAVLFAREGADIGITYLGAEQRDAEATKKAVEKEGRRCLLIPGDVRDRKFCEDAVGRTVREFGKLNILVNNAAFQMHVPRFEDLT